MPENSKIYEIELILDNSSPGTGKTTSISNFIKRNPDKVFAIIASTHDILTVYEEQLQKGTYTHWYGKKNFCGLKGLFNSGISTRNICKIGHKLKCPECAGCKVGRQYKKKKGVNTYLLVNAYLGLKQTNKIKFNNIFNDEDILKVSSQILEPPDAEITEAQIEIFKKGKGYKYIPQYKKVEVDDPLEKIKYFYTNFDIEIARAVEEYCKNLIINEYVKKGGDILIKENKLECKDEIILLKSQSPQDIKLWYSYKQYYDSIDINTDRFIVTPLTALFNQCINSDIHRIFYADATVNIDMIKSFIYDYSNIKLFTDGIDVRINIRNESIRDVLGGLETFDNPPKIPNKDSKVIRLGFPNWYPRSEVRKYSTLKDIVKKIAELSVLHDLDMIPIICTKETKGKEKEGVWLVNKIDALIKKELENDEKDRKVMIITYGRDRSKNDFVGHPVSFIIGTYTPNYEELKNKVELENPRVKREGKYGMKKMKEGEGFRFIEHDEFSKLLNRQLDYEQNDANYQCNYRTRGLNHTIINYNFCIVSERIKKELDYTELTEKEYIIYKRPMQTKKGMKIKNAKEMIKNYLNYLRKRGDESIKLVDLERWCKWKGIGKIKTIDIVNEILKNSKNIWTMNSRKEGYIIYLF